MKKTLLICLFIFFSFNVFSQEKLDAKEMCKDMYLNSNDESVYNKYIGGQVVLNGKFKPVYSDETGTFYYDVRKIIKDGKTRALDHHITPSKTNIDKIKIDLIAEKEMTESEADIYMKMKNQRKTLLINNIIDIFSTAQYDMETEVLTLECQINGELFELND